MTTVPDSVFFENATRVKDKVVLITGAANGLGRSAALFFAKHGAKVVIGDLDIKGAEEVVAEIKSSGCDAIAQKCDVTSWEQQLSLFQLAISTFKRLDIVVPNAGVTEIGRLYQTPADKVDGQPTKPKLKTLEVNLIAVLYTVRLGLFHLLGTYAGSNELKAMVFVGSMSSIEAIPLAPLYSTSKHAVVGLMSSLHGQYGEKIRFAAICPWFADTSIIPTPIKIFMAGLPLTPISRIGGAIFRAATDPDPETNGAIWTLPDDGPVFRIDRSQLLLNQGVYKLINDRTKMVTGVAFKIQHLFAILKDLFRIAGNKTSVLALAVGVAIGVFAWMRALHQ